VKGKLWFLGFAKTHRARLMRDRPALRAGSKSSKLVFFFFFAFCSSLLLGVFARKSFFGSFTPNLDKSQTKN
jgi:hypothetical protein